MRKKTGPPVPEEIEAAEEEQRSMLGKVPFPARVTSRSFPASL